MIRNNYKNPGQRLAESHRSVLGQVNSRQVYKALRKASRQEVSLSTEQRSNVRAKAIRVALDRVRRIGERIRENNHVSVRDRNLMEKELVAMTDEIVRIFSNSRTDASVQGQYEQFDLKEIPDQMRRIVDSIYNGEISLKDRVSMLGDKITETDDLNILEFDGTYRLKAAGKYRHLDAVDILTEQVGTGTERFEVNVTGDPPGKNTIGDLVDVMQDRARADADDPLSAHDLGGSLESIKLIF